VDDETSSADEHFSSEREDRRTFDRSRLLVDVFFDGKDATGIASTKDLSAGGLYMNTQAEIPEGAVLSLRIPLGQHQIVVDAEVIYANPQRGVGVKFRNLSTEDRALLAGEIPT